MPEKVQRLQERREGGHRRKKRKTDNKYRGNNRRFWRAGQPLTEEDQKLLETVRKRYQELGYSPPRGEVSVQYVRKLRQRFRIWEDVLKAAGLPSLKAPDQTRKRMAAAKRPPDNDEIDPKLRPRQ